MNVAWLCVGVLVGTIGVTTSAARDWPRFRGPHGAGVADDQPLPTSWNGLSGDGVLWKTAIPGVGHSSPVVSGDRVFLTTAISSAPRPNYNPKSEGTQPSDDESVHEWRVLALDKRSGRLQWSHTAHRGVPARKRHIKATQANSTPATDGRIVVVSFGSEGLYAFDVNGRRLWKQDVGVLVPGYAGQPDLSWGFATSPIIYRGLVILQCDIQQGSFMIAFRLDDGSVAWRVTRDEIPAWSTPVIYEGPARTELVTSGSKYYRGYDPLTGKELWRLRDDTQVKVPSPVVYDGLFFLSGGNPRGRDFYAVRANASGDISLAAGRESGPHVVWRKPRGSPYTPTPLVYEGLLYVLNDNGVLTVYDAVTGTQVYVTRVGSTNATFSASPVAGRGHIYASSEDGEVYTIRAGVKYELVAVNEMGEALMATPAISDGTMFIRGQQHLFAVR